MFATISAKRLSNLSEEIQNYPNGAPVSLFVNGDVSVGDFIISKPTGFTDTMIHYKYICKYERPSISPEENAKWYVNHFITHDVAIEILRERLDLMYYQFPVGMEMPFNILDVVRHMMAEILPTL